jgi:hypothetical protein
MSLPNPVHAKGTLETGRGRRDAKRDTTNRETEMNTGFVIRLLDGTYAAKSGNKYDGPITKNLIAARFFSTFKGAETTLKKLRQDGAYGRKFTTVTITPVTIKEEI